MANHVIISAYFGDYEFDVGATVRWHQYFFDTCYARDVAVDSKSRNHLLAWDATFGDVRFSYSKKPFFDPAGLADAAFAADWRKQSFLKADVAWNYQPSDWVFFLDGTECLTFDLQAGAPDPERFVQDGETPLEAWILQLLSSVAIGQDTLTFPFWAYTRSSAPWFGSVVVDPALESVLDGLGAGSTYNGMPVSDVRAMNRSHHQFNYNYFVKGGYLPRAFKVSTLRDPGFDWSTLDTFVDLDETVPEMGVSLVSYAYAKYGARENYDPATGEQANDFDQRSLISRVRPIDGLGTDFVDTADEYVAAMPVDEATGLPYAPPLPPSGTQFSPEFSSDFASFDRPAVASPSPSQSWPDATEYQLDTTVYGPQPFRKKVWAGLTYLAVSKGGEVSPVPWNFVAGQPALDPAGWAARQQTPFRWTP